MGRHLIILLVAVLALATSTSPAQNSDTPQHARKVVHMVKPVYPDLARRLQMSGVVRLRATVAPDGSVKSIEPVGGHPILIKAAQDAVTNWKFAPAPAETRELIELDFKTR